MTVEKMETKLIQITAGRGPAECCWVVAQVLKLILLEAAQKGVKAAVVARAPGLENGTLNSALVQIEAPGQNEFLASWIGTIQWIGQSSYRKYHKRKNWFVGVELVKATEAFDFKETDVKYQAIRSGGPGGQHVNKVSTAIRATHLPSGISVVASDTRSQSQNKKNAKRRLIALLEQKNTASSSAEYLASWHNHNELKRGNPVRVFIGSSFKRKPIENKVKSDRRKARSDLKKQNWDND